MSDNSQISNQKVPQHVAIIMDGNGRWAQEKGEDRIFGHANGVEAVRASLKAATELGVKYLTLYAFSTENWQRPKEEVDALMDLLVQTILGELDELHENGVRLGAIGDIKSLPSSCQTGLADAIEKTKGNKTITLTLALSYSARWEITEGIRRIVKDGHKVEDINEDLVERYLHTSDIPDPELMIRTSGEQRISNFLLWQLAYSELYFTSTFWPDFKKEDFYKAITEYQSRERRFGKTSDQITLKSSQ